MTEPVLPGVAERVLRQITNNALTWKLAHATVLRASRWLLWAEASQLAGDERGMRSIAELADHISPRRLVMHGPFRGMQYPHDEAAGSQLLPKLLGSYEIEISQLIEDACTRPVSSIVDVGCAEGYYAVGFAMRRPGLPIFAFDVDPRARELCQQMAALNGVQNHVTIRERCTPDALTSLPLGDHSLVIVDCEGYEDTLLTESVAARLRAHSVLVELHDFVVPGVSRAVAGRFRRTHRILPILSIDDTLKAVVLGYPQLSGLSGAERRRVLTERRPRVMQWLYMEPLSAA
jgi:hypothetical protein